MFLKRPPTRNVTPSALTGDECSLRGCFVVVMSSGVETSLNAFHSCEWPNNWRFLHFGRNDKIVPLNGLPMTICHEQLELRTKGKGLYEITEDVRSKIDSSGVRFLFGTPVAVSSLWRMPTPQRAATWKHFSIGWSRKMPITSRTVRKGATTCHHISGWR